MPRTAPRPSRKKTTRPRKKKSPAAPRRVRATFGEPAAEIMPGLRPFMPTAEPAPASPVSLTYVELPGLGDAQQRLSAALKSFLDSVGRAIQDAATLEVKTYVSDAMEGVQFQADGKTFAGSVTLRAFTAISLDGDVNACVPLEAESVDTSLWTVHTAMVAQAQANRTELMKLALSAASSVIGVLKPV